MLTDIECVVIPEQDHYMVYINGEFYSSADTWSEARDDIEKYLNEKGE